MAWKKKLRRSLVIHFLLLFIVFDSLGMLIFFLVDSSLLQKAKEREMAVVQELMTELSYLLVSQIDYYSMTVLIGSKVISEYREHSTEFNSNTIDLFNFILMNNPSIFQIRMISDEGYERIRLDQSGGLISLTDEKDLQYKGDRYYFQESFKLNYGEVYLSPIDLNIENSKIEIPYRPTIRLGTPIFDHEDKKIGVAVLNIDLSSVLSQFKEKSNSSLSIELLNSNGYYIAGPDSTSLWGFMFNKPITMAINNPEIWNYIRENKNGFVKMDKSIGYFHTIDSDSDDDMASAKYRWVIFARSEIGNVVATRGYSGRVFFIALQLICFVLGLVFSLILNKITREKDRRHQAEALLVKNEEMASLGRLVAGIAHELNTPIGTSVTLASTISDEIDRFSRNISGGQIKKSQIDNSTDIIAKASNAILLSLNRASDLIRRFKQVSVDESSERLRSFYLSEYIHDVIETLMPTIKKSAVTIEIHCDSSIKMNSYPGAIAQILTNLILNSIEHGHLKADGIITIDVLKRKKMIHLSIRDNGRGISPEALPFIFEPFFTTTDSNGGSGLGLQIVNRQVVDKLNGTISVESEYGKFTEFKMSFPI